MTQNLVMFGRENCIPIEVMFGDHTHEANRIYGDFVWKLEWVQHAHNVAQKHLNNSANRQKELYDAKINANWYQYVGD